MGRWLMRIAHLPYEVEARLRKDLLLVQRHVEELLLGGKPNHRVSKHSYLTPVVDPALVLHKTDEKGELRHYLKVRSILEYAFEHDGKIKDKYRPMLQEIEAPEHVTGLVEG
jgi:hypothetical protein